MKNFFDDINFNSIVDTIKGVYLSDGTMATLLDFERCLDSADLYAFRNWILGELVHGPITQRYTVSCVFLWPYHLMPDPAGSKRLLKMGCRVKFKKTKIKIPVKVNDYEDFQPGTRYPKTKRIKIWLVSIEMPKNMMDDIKQGWIDLAGQTIDLNELEKGYSQDLDQEETEQSSKLDQAQNNGLVPPHNM